MTIIHTANRHSTGLSLEVAAPSTAFVPRIALDDVGASGLNQARQRDRGAAQSTAANRPHQGLADMNYTSCLESRTKPAAFAPPAPRRPDDECSIYTINNVDDIPITSIRNLSWPQLRYISALIRNGVHHYIDNIPRDVEYGLIFHRNCALPFTVSRREAVAFPISPKTCYFSYPLLIEEKSYGGIKAPLARLLLRLLERRVRFKNIAVLNNWFITNNPTPAFSAEDLRAFVKTLTLRYPGCLVILKSVPETDPTNIIPALRSEGFSLLKWRTCHYWRPSGAQKSRRTKQFRVDRRLLQNTHLNAYYASRMSEADAAACEALYQALYIDKHTPMNVELNRRWFSLTCNSGFLDYFMIADAQKLKAFAISYKDSLGLNTGFLGYDLKDGRELGLYRMVVISTILRAIDEDWTVNLSTGVARFKELRGALPSNEYEALYAKHLSLRARFLTPLLVWAYNRFGDGIRSR